VSWVEEVRHEVYRKEVSRTCVLSMEDSIVSTLFSILTEEEDGHEEMRVGFCLFIEGVTNEKNWTT
jgi:hypothetical protein